jgi:hypothetical protein
MDPTRIRTNTPEPPQQHGRDDDDAAQREPQTQDLPELPDPAEVGESG